MSIPTHQIHNVLTAYARRLHERRAAGYGGNTAEPNNSGERRRALIQKMTVHFIDKTIGQHLKEKPQPQTSVHRKSITDDQLVYHELDAGRKTVRCCPSRWS
jgi:hypothetical protein